MVATYAKGVEMIGGEFYVNGVWVPNHFTSIGAQAVLKAAFWQEHPDWFMGLCAHNPGDALQLGLLLEPTIGTNGYERVELGMNAAHWTNIGQVNGNNYVESREVEFIPAGGAFNRETNRLFLTDGLEVIAVSSPLEAGLVAQSTPLTTKYRLYLR